jgi:enoyl-CoA hydratase
MANTVRATDVEPGIRLLELDRPQRLNAISPQLLEDLHAELAHLAEDRTCRVVLLTGRGRGFCAGLDLVVRRSDAAESAHRSAQDRMRLQKRIAALVPTLRNLPQAVIAAVNGPAAGGGLALALAADVRIAGASARFGDAFVRIGLSGCDIGVSWLLPRLIGASRRSSCCSPGGSSMRPRRTGSGWSPGSCRTRTCRRPPSAWPGRSLPAARSASG